MIAFLQTTLAPYYIYIKFVHVIFVMMWVFSTSVAYAYFLLPVMKAWRRNPQDGEVMVMRDWIMERFDEGVIYEHIAFPMILITGPLLYVVGGWNTGKDCHPSWVCGKFFPSNSASTWMGYKFTIHNNNGGSF